MTLFDRLFQNRIDARVAEAQQELMERHCEEVRTVYEQMRGWRHDYKNHIAAMQASLRTGNTEALDRYLTELSADLSSVDTVVKTGSVMVDAILNSKLTLAASRQISTDATAALPGKTPVTDVELCVILGNLLDNAIEACAAVEDPAERFLRVYIGRFKGQLYISVTNAMAGQPKKTGRTYETTKGENHGFGLKRVDKTVKKYGGYLNRQHEDGVFCTEIMLPLTEE